MKERDEFATAVCRFILTLLCIDVTSTSHLDMSFYMNREDVQDYHGSTWPINKTTSSHQNVYNRQTK